MSRMLTPPANEIYCVFPLTVKAFYKFSISHHFAALFPQSSLTNHLPFCGHHCGFYLHSLHTLSLLKKIPCTPGNYIQSLVIQHDRRQCGKTNMCVCMTGSLCSTAGIITALKINYTSVKMVS